MPSRPSDRIILLAQSIVPMDMLRFIGGTGEPSQIILTASDMHRDGSPSWQHATLQSFHCCLLPANAGRTVSAYQQSSLDGANGAVERCGPGEKLSNKAADFNQELIRDLRAAKTRTSQITDETQQG